MFKYSHLVCKQHGYHLTPEHIGEHDEDLLKDMNEMIEYTYSNNI